MELNAGLPVVVAVAGGGVAAGTGAGVGAIMTEAGARTGATEKSHLATVARAIVREERQFPGCTTRSRSDRADQAAEL